MAERPTTKYPRQAGDKKEEDVKQQRAEVHYLKGFEQLDRWRAEFMQAKEAELRLASLSKINYEPVDYNKLTEPIPFKEKPLTDCTYLLEEAKNKVENRFLMPIATRIGILFFLVVLLIAFFSVLTLWITGALAVAAGAALYLAIKERTQELFRAQADAQAEIDCRRETEIEQNEQARLQHEMNEEARISAAEKMLKGDTGAVLARIDEVLPKLKFPFPVIVDIQIYENVPLVKVWLPARTVIPRILVELLPSGRIQHQDKEYLTYNKQYLEVSASVIMHIVSTLYANIPSFDKGYVLGCTKEDSDDICMMAADFDRDMLISACPASTGLSGLQSFNLHLECDTMLSIKAIDALMPEGWKDIEQKLIRGIHIKILRY